MPRRRTVMAGIVSTLALAAVGCGVSGYNSKCSGNGCTYDFNGAQTLKLDFLRKGSKLELKDFGKGQMKVVSSGAEATVLVGKQQSFAGFLLDLESLDGDNGKLLIQTAPKSS